MGLRNFSKGVLIGLALVWASVIFIAAVYFLAWAPRVYDIFAH